MIKAKSQKKFNVEYYHTDKYYSDDSERLQDREVLAIGFLNSLGEHIRVLDVGCGKGKFLSYLTTKDKTGFDISKTAIEALRKKGIKGKYGDVQDALPFPSGSFDAVYCGEIIEHVLDTDFFLAECSRVLRKGGHLVITTPNFGSLRSAVEVLVGRQPKWLEYRFDESSAGHVRYYTWNALKKHVQMHGFRVVKMKPTEMAYDFWRFDRGLPVRVVSKSASVIVPRFGRGVLLIAQKTSQSRHSRG